MYLEQFYVICTSLWNFYVVSCTDSFMELPVVNARKPFYRFTVLFLNSLLSFGSYFCFDMPSVLQYQIQGNYSTNCSYSDKSCCSDCCGLTGSEYNLIYAVYAWANAAVVVWSGFLIDKLGNRIGVYLFSSLCVVGTSLFAVGSMLRGNGALLPLMLFGRLLFGAGNGSLTIVQYRITTFWFTGKELALAFGVTVAFSRLGSALNFFLTIYIHHFLGLVGTLWVGSGLCAIGFLFGIITSHLDAEGMNKLGQTRRIVTHSKRMRIRKIKDFSVSFWLVALIIMFFYDSVFPFVADSSKFIQDKYGYDHHTSSHMAGAVYGLSVILSPPLGALIDIYGKRGVFAVICSALPIPVFGLLAFTHVYPLVSTLCLGIAYSIAAASLWSSIALVVPQAAIGTAMGLATSFQMLGIGITNLIVGEILGKDRNVEKEELLHRWKYVMIYFLANTFVSTSLAVCLTIYDVRKGGILNMNKEELNRLVGRIADEPSSCSETQESDSDTEDFHKVKPFLRGSILQYQTSSSSIDSV